MKIITDLADKIQKDGWMLRDILLEQHKYHESRRWSVDEIIQKHNNNPEAHIFSVEDKAALWHVTRGEATTQPGGISIAVNANELANEYASSNKTAEVIFKALEAWLVRHWLNEEGHHEVGFSMLADMANIEKISDKELIQHKQFFPADKIGRKLILQACVEIEVTISYSHMVKNSKNPLIKEMFRAVQKDESQHRLYFISFAKALVDIGVVPVKDILSMAYSWVRSGGDTYNTERKNVPKRDGYINWWESVDSNSGYKMDEKQYKNNKIHKQKETSVFQLVRFITDIRVNNISDLKKAYLSSLKQTKKVA